MNPSPALWLRLHREEDETFPSFMRFFKSQCDSLDIWPGTGPNDPMTVTVIRGDYQFEGIPLEGFPRFHDSKRGPSPQVREIVVIMAITRVAVNTFAKGYKPFTTPTT